MADAARPREDGMVRLFSYTWYMHLHHLTDNQPEIDRRYCNKMVTRACAMKDRGSTLPFKLLWWCGSLKWKRQQGRWNSCSLESKFRRCAIVHSFVFVCTSCDNSLCVVCNLCIFLVCVMHVVREHTYSDGLYLISDILSVATRIATTDSHLQLIFIGDDNAPWLLGFVSLQSTLIIWQHSKGAFGTLIGFLACLINQCYVVVTVEHS